MNRTSLIVLLATSMAASVGCASKNYVRQETTPLINKTNELDDLTAKNTNAIKDVDARAQAGIQEVRPRLPRLTRRRKPPAAGRPGPDPGRQRRPSRGFAAEHRGQSGQLSRRHRNRGAFRLRQGQPDQDRARKPWISSPPTCPTPRATSSLSKAVRIPSATRNTTTA